jgi:hypothetical protein
MQSRLILSLVASFVLALSARLADDPLPDWNEGASKKAITEFVSRVTKPGSPDFVKPEERIAVFDNDGTLWSEQPIYVQFAFALDRVKAMAPKHPEWKDKEPFKSILAGDMRSLEAAGEKGVVELVMATHSGMTTDEFGRGTQVKARARRADVGESPRELVRASSPTGRSDRCSGATRSGSNGSTRRPVRTSRRPTTHCR